MSPISDSQYRRAVTEYVCEALKRPPMYFRDLGELQSVLFGHEVAFHQMGNALACGDHGFRRAFEAWLYSTEGVSGSAGWARAVEEVAARRAVEPVEAFRELFASFEPEWNSGDCKREDS